MVTLFDQEKVWEIHDYNVAQAARQEGLERGLEKGIHSMVSMLEELSFSKEDIAQKLVSKFDLPIHVAEEKVKRYSTQ